MWNSKNRWLHKTALGFAFTILSGSALASDDDGPEPLVSFVDSICNVGADVTDRQCGPSIVHPHDDGQLHSLTIEPLARSTAGEFTMTCPVGTTVISRGYYMGNVQCTEESVFIPVDTIVPHQKRIWEMQFYNTGTCPVVIEAWGICIADIVDIGGHSMKSDKSQKKSKKNSKKKSKKS